MFTLTSCVPSGSSNLTKLVYYTVSADTFEAQKLCLFIKFLKCLLQNKMFQKQVCEVRYVAFIQSIYAKHFLNGY